MFRFNFLNLLIASSILLFAQVAQSQITPDTTLGNERSTIAPRTSGGEQITGGAIRGSNLFHSFGDFNISNGSQVYFANPTGIQNILTRVTGSSASNINGTLGVDGSANLFFLNPNGILFGQNARLDVKGSFIGSTANGVRFGTQGEFSTTNPQAPPLLTVQPSALLFSQLQGGEIVNRARSTDSIGLTVPTGKSLLLVGGNVTSEGGQITVPGGRVELGGLAAPGSVALTNFSDRWQLSFPTGVQRADVTLNNQGIILVSGGLDDIVLTGRNITVTDSPLLPVLVKEIGGSERRVGNLVLNATGNASLDYSNTQSRPLENQPVEATGSIRIAAENIFLKRTSIGEVATNSLGQSVNFSASNTITLDRSTIASSRNLQSGETTGDINIASRNLNLTNQSRILTFLSNGATTSANVSVQVQDTLLLSGGSILGSIGDNVGAALPGRSGNVDIQAGTIVLDGLGDSILAFSNGTRSGDIKIKADTITMSGRITSVSSGAADGGNIEIQARLLSILNGGGILTSANGAGNSGNLIITASEGVELKGNTSELIQIGDNDFIFGNSTLSTNSFGVGNAGQISLSTRRLTIRDGGIISTGTGANSSGRGGNLIINASEMVDIAGEGKDGRTTSLISSGTLGTGNAGDLSISTGRLQVRDGAVISTLTSQSTANAKGGNIIIKALDRIEIGGRSRTGLSRLNSSTRGGGDAGDITLQTGSLSIVDGSITSTTRGSGQGGNVQLDVDSLTMTAGNITANTEARGNAGNVTIKARGSVLFNGIAENGEGSFISVSSALDALGKPGNILLEADSVRFVEGGSILAIAQNDQPGGNITLNVRDSITFQGKDRVPASSGLFASSVGAGNGGNVLVNAQRLDILDEAAISAVSFGSGNAGSITINAPFVRLANDARISARSGATDGGNVTITAPDALVLRRNSRISASAGTEQVSGNGGNIAISAGSIVAKPAENNTIQANARAGRGGNIAITTQALLGIAPSSTLIPGQNTITASSELGIQGNVLIVQPTVQPTQGVVELSNNILDASNQIAQVCPRNSELAKVGKFTVSRAGSLPPNPINPLAGDSVVSQLASLEGFASNRSTANPAIQSSSSPIIEAQGWIKTVDGKVVLVAQPSEATSPTIAACPTQPTANPSY
ncbi:MAG: filamentous hemagglutinin N-terminal domain-containing protein [Leptolyngbya sp. Prado105]|jgi:filamentous hemagglutinin family protein|nr:filamentous hemagglutinin N-terminal domain-containing protein [Leptolyngbya sp. Prado105]